MGLESNQSVTQEQWSTGAVNPLSVTNRHVQLHPNLRAQTLLRERAADAFGGALSHLLADVLFGRFA